MNNNDHESVLIDQIINIIKLDHYQKPIKKLRFLDLTFGAGGYSQRFLNEFDESTVFAFDRDQISTKYSDLIKSNLLDKSRFKFFINNFANASDVLTQNQIDENFFDYIFFDLGVSSMQLDDKSRGFSFYGENNVLDMRMDKNQELSAYSFLNNASENEIADIIFYYGDERNARKIAKKIVEYRVLNKKIQTTEELANIILKINKFKKNNIYRASKSISIHPATKTFQAIRIHINSELDNLIIALEKTAPFLKNSGGKMFCVSFHSLEDKIIKNFFKYMEFGLNAPEEIKKFFPRINSDENNFFYKYKFKNHKSIIEPNADEIKKNIRSRSAKMRILESIKNI